MRTGTRPRRRLLIALASAVTVAACARAPSAPEAADGRSAPRIYEGVLEPPKGKTPDDWEPRPQTLFRATDFGDDVDRPLRKSDGSNTYFANDIAYHADKVRRAQQLLIEVKAAAVNPSDVKAATGLMPYAVFPRTSGRDAITPADVNAVHELFHDAKYSARLLAEQADKYIS